MRTELLFWKREVNNVISCDILIIIFLIYQYKFLGYKEWRATNNKKGASKIWNIQDAIEPQTGKFRAKVVHVGRLIWRNAISELFFSQFDIY